MQFPWFLFAAAVMSTAAANAQRAVPAGSDVIHAGGIEFAFADVDQGRQLLGQNDRFVKHMSPLDRQVRMRTGVDEGVDAFLKFTAAAVLPWPPEKKAAVRSAIESLSEPLSQFRLVVANPVMLIHTSGREESRAAYTRGSAIILPPNMIVSSLAKNRKLLAHELFHVVSRANPELRDRLYELIGFRSSNQISLPAGVGLLRLTNPDAPVVEHVIQVKLAAERSGFVAPMLYSEVPFDGTNPRSLFSLLKFQLMEVESNSEQAFVSVIHEGKPVFHDPSLPDYQRQIGRNTKYIVHPEEIIAVNFSLLLTGAKVKDSWVTDGIRKVLADLGR